MYKTRKQNTLNIHTFIEGKKTGEKILLYEKKLRTETIQNKNVSLNYTDVTGTVVLFVMFLHCEVGHEHPATRPFVLKHK